MNDLDKFNYIILEIERGSSLRQAIKGLEMSSRTFYELLDSDKELQKRYARACEERHDSLFDEILEIADNANLDIKGISDSGAPIIDGEAIQRSRLRIDARKWSLAKMNPKKYGDRTEIDHKSSDGTMSPTPISFSKP